MNIVNEAFAKLLVLFGGSGPHMHDFGPPPKAPPKQLNLFICESYNDFFGNKQIVYYINPDLNPELFVEASRQLELF